MSWAGMRPAGSPQRVVDRRSPHGFKGITERNDSTHGQRVGKHRGQAELLSVHMWELISKAGW